MSHTWDTALESATDSELILSHDMRCPRCGHTVHTVLPCGDGCDCQPTALPGERP